MAKLTPKQQRVVDEYLIDLNATQAAIRAGYSPKTAEQQGFQLLKKTSVSEAIEQAQQERRANEIQHLNERLTQAQTEREQTQQAASVTREDAAGMRGELEALRVQNAALLATLAPAAPAKDGKGKSKPT